MLTLEKQNYTDGPLFFHEPLAWFTSAPPEHFRSRFYSESEAAAYADVSVLMADMMQVDDSPEFDAALADFNHAQTEPCFICGDEYNHYGQPHGELRTVYEGRRKEMSPEVAEVLKTTPLDAEDIFETLYKKEIIVRLHILGDLAAVSGTKRVLAERLAAVVKGKREWYGLS